MIFLACSTTSCYWLVQRASLLIVPARVSAGLLVCGVESLLSGLWQRGDVCEAGSFFGALGRLSKVVCLDGLRLFGVFFALPIVIAISRFGGL